MPPELKAGARLYSYDALLCLYDMMHDKSIHPRYRIRAAEVILERGWGKASLGGDNLPANYPEEEQYD